MPQCSAHWARVHFSMVVLLSQGGDGLANAGEDRVGKLLTVVEAAGEAPGAAEAPLDVDLAVGGVEVDLGDLTEDPVSLVVADLLAAQVGPVDAAGLVPADL